MVVFEAAEVAAVLSLPELVCHTAEPPEVVVGVGVAVIKACERNIKQRPAFASNDET